MSSTQYRLVTVNTVPERAKRLIGRVVDDVKDRYTIVHVANVESEPQTIPYRTAVGWFMECDWIRNRGRERNSGAREAGRSRELLLSRPNDC